MKLFNSLRKLTILTTMTCILSVIAVGHSLAAVVQVGPAPDGQYATIQAAIDAAAVGDTVVVAPGVYSENIAITKSLVVASLNGAAVTTIQSPDLGTAVSITASEVTLDGFTITGAKSAISMLGSSNGMLKNNVIQSGGNLSHGIQVFQQSNGNRFENNRISGAHFGMFLTHNSNNNEIVGGLVENCQFGIYMSVLTGASVSGVDFQNNVWHGLFLESAQSVQISDNDFVGNGNGISAGRANGNRVYHNNFIDNQQHVSVPRELVLAKSYAEGGNYWSGMVGVDQNFDGILDDPYVAGDANAGRDAIDPFPVAAPSGWNNISPLSFVTNQITGERFSGIQAAVDAAIAGDVLLVDANDPSAASGLKSYYENVAVSKSVSIRGHGAESTTLNALDRAGKIFSVTASDLAIQDMSLLEGAMGVHLNGSQNTLLADLYVASSRNQSYGILVGNQSLNASLQNIHVENHQFGMFITQGSHGAKVVGGSVAGNRFGIYSVAYTGGEITGVEFLQNQWYGLFIETARDLVISENNFMGNDTGLSAGGGGHRIFHNNFIGNSIQARGGSGSTWDDGYPSGGNHWSDWTSPDLLGGEFQDQNGGDGFVDLAYNPVAGISDRYPFVRVSGWAITPEKVFGQIRAAIEALTTASIPAPNAGAAEGWRNSLLGKLSEAEAYYLTGQIVETVDKLNALAKKCDGLHKGGPDQIVDDPATAVDEPKSIYDLIQSQITLIAA